MLSEQERAALERVRRLHDADETDLSSMEDVYGESGADYLADLVCVSGISLRCLQAPDPGPIDDPEFLKGLGFEQKGMALVRQCGPSVDLMYCRGDWFIENRSDLIELDPAPKSRLALETLISLLETGEVPHA